MATTSLFSLLVFVWGFASWAALGQEEIRPRLSEERVVFQLETGDIEFALLPEVAPVTTKHIFTLVALGCYTSNHFFRVDKGFVAQTADVSSGRTIPLNAKQREFADKNVPLEVVEGVKHHEGSVAIARGNDPNSGGSSFFVMYGDAPRVLSMGRYDDPNSGTSSFSILLGDAAHLDMQYTIFGKVTSGMDVLHGLEKLETRREGIFVMPLNRITILNSYWYYATKPHQMLPTGGAGGDAASELEELKLRFASQAEELQRVRKKCLPA